MQPTSSFVQSVNIKENYTIPFQLLQMETLYSERQGHLCLAKAKEAKDLQTMGIKSHLPSSAPTPTPTAACHPWTWNI